MAQTSLGREVILRLVDLRAMDDPDTSSDIHYLSFNNIQRIINREFPGLNLDAQTLERRWVHPIRPAMRRDFRALGGLDERARAALGLSAEMGNQRRPMKYQEAHELSFRAPQPGGGASFGGSQTGHAGSHWGPQPGYGNQHAAPQAGPSDPYGRSQPGHYYQYGNSHAGPSGSFGGSHVGHGGQYGAHPPSFTGPYQNTPGANQYPGPAASHDPRFGNLQLPPITPVAQVPSNPGPSIAEPAYQMSNQNNNNAAWQEAGPGVQGQMNWYRTSVRGSNSRNPHGGAVSEQTDFDQKYEFPREEQNWLLDNGIYMVHGHRAGQEFYDNFRRAYSDHRVPSKGRVLEEFNRLRML